MKRKLSAILASALAACLFSAIQSPAATHYVNVNGNTPTSPYTNWLTAATNIQDAVNAASTGDTIMVTNGVYPGTVNVTNLLVLVGVKGPQFTIIDGLGVDRCAFLADGASLTGFTLTNGAASVSGGGVYCTSTNAFLTNCMITGNRAAGYLISTYPHPTGVVGQGAGVYRGTLYDCVINSNQVRGYGYWTGSGIYRTYHYVPGHGGGALGSTLHNSTLTGNSGDDRGGGAYSCTLYDCTLTGNSATTGGGACVSILHNCTLAHNSGGGASGGTLYNCTLTSNYGSGASAGTLYNCALTGNSGGGALSCTLYNCALTGNRGAGVSGGTLYNCTLTGNSGAGASGGTLYNCILWGNHTITRSDANYTPSSTLNYCCTTPLPPNGTGNTDLDPQLASATHLSADSPCRQAGSAAYATGTDLDGEPWAHPPSIGCDEYNPGDVTGPLAGSIVVDYTNVVVGFTVQLAALIEGRTAHSVWDFGDGVLATNQPVVSHCWTLPGDYGVVLSAFNESHPDGVSATQTVHVVTKPVLYVAAASTNPQPPYVSWGTAATNIQSALDAAPAGASVLVSNGVYFGGVTVDTPLELQSVLGPVFTVINANFGDYCASLRSGASLSGFTLSNASSGVECESLGVVVTNCVITGNGLGVSGGTLYNCAVSGNSQGGASEAVMFDCTLSDNYSSGSGAGACGGELHRCTLTGNQSDEDGGGAYGSELYNCTLAGNWAYFWGGGALNCTLYDCVLTGNSSWQDGGGAHGGELHNCTLTQNSAVDYGGGAYSSTLYNCILTGNQSDDGGGGAYDAELYSCSLADNRADWGGGALYCTLYNCTLAGNSAGNNGGGAESCSLYGCTLTGNSAAYSGGGTLACDLANCILYFNTAPQSANYDDTLNTVNYCCTTPMPTNGIGNITNTPLFVDYDNDNLHLQTNSPGINAGNNDYVTTTSDLDGNPRIAGGAVDMGAYEFQPCITGGQFCDAACSRLAGLSFTFSGAIVGQPYRVQTSTNLAAGSWTDLTNFTYTGSIVITDLSARAGPKKFYRAVTP